MTAFSEHSPSHRTIKHTNKHLTSAKLKQAVCSCIVWENIWPFRCSFCCFNVCLLDMVLQCVAYFWALQRAVIYFRNTHTPRTPAKTSWIACGGAGPLVCCILFHPHTFRFLIFPLRRFILPEIRNTISSSAPAYPCLCSWCTTWAISAFYSALSSVSAAAVLPTDGDWGSGRGGIRHHHHCWHFVSTDPLFALFPLHLVCHTRPACSPAYLYVV